MEELPENLKKANVVDSSFAFPCPANNFIQGKMTGRILGPEIVWSWY